MEKLRTPNTKEKLIHKDSLGQDVYVGDYILNIGVPNRPATDLGHKGIVTSITGINTFDKGMTSSNFTAFYYTTFPSTVLTTINITNTNLPITQKWIKKHKQKTPVVLNYSQVKIQLPKILRQILNQHLK